MAPSLSLASLLTTLSLATSTLAQNPPISTSPTFVLYPYITSGSLTGPYPNAAIDKSQPLRPTSGRASGTWTTDCFNRLVFTSYISPTHCSGEQCGYQRWSLNATDPSAGEKGQTLAGYISGLSSMLIVDADESGRRDVGWTANACGNEPRMKGFEISDEGEEGWVEGDIYGPRVFYRREEGETPEGCAEVLLVPRCVNETSLVQGAVGSRCYLGGLPA
ncbi:hypothetical protein M409DRAFT_68060 [Zasmidium cellare ATCC 36951]|uniref:Cell wall protein YJL171C/Tos1 C-terminal domain-containing protein n=1 Tax=Zasmidium cellare ATCC 36951 TaxID=1080233 RepID=A0A6A6CAD6_ZASCE|nr:uncharacterized protein M409DRAFT_68060 [Zasmidium cellare ATCC 36951]KAF2164157.1 hypothetical protein M409DRAFT_68060 [Zasmidium cellare ATCC 36951]